MTGPALPLVGAVVPLEGVLPLVGAAVPVEGVLPLAGAVVPVEGVLPLVGAVPGEPPLGGGATGSVGKLIGLGWIGVKPIIGVTDGFGGDDMVVSPILTRRYA